MSDQSIYAPVAVAAAQHQAVPLKVVGFDFEWPDWYYARKSQPTQNRRVARGLHPFGSPLGPEASECGTCAFVKRRRRWSKCSLNTDKRFGPGTDVKLKWRGCASWVFDPSSRRKKSRYCPECGGLLHQLLLGDQEGPPRRDEIAFPCSDCGGMFVLPEVER